MIGSFLVAWCDAQADLKAIVHDQVYAQAADDGATGEYIVYHTITDNRPARHLRGVGGLRAETLQLDLVGPTFARLKDIQAILLGDDDTRRLDGFSVRLGDPVYAGLSVYECRWLDSRDLPNDPQHGGMNGPQMIQMDFKFTYGN